MLRRLSFLLASALLLAAGSASAGDAQLPRGVQSGIKVQRFTMSGDKGTKWAAASIESAKKNVTAEVFAIGDKRVVKAMEGRLDKKVQVRGNADPENIRSGVIQKLIRSGADFRPWGGNGLRRDGSYDHKLNANKVHAKAIHFDDKSWLSTASLRRGNSTRSVDATAIVSGKDASAARAVTEAAYRGDIGGLRQAAAAGLRRGILVNSAAVGIDHYTQTEREVIRNASSELIVSKKIVDSKIYARELSDAAARGVKVTLWTHDEKMGDGARKELSSGIRRIGDPFGVLHANMVIADRKVGIFGSAHASSRALGEGSRRLSHEMGYLVTDPKVLDEMRSAVLAFVPKK